MNEAVPYFLYIEDDCEDVDLLKHALTNTPFNFNIVHVHNGEEACNYLETAKAFGRLPELIFMDINMSKLDGKETLVCLKADRGLARIPMVVLSTSNLESDIKFFSKYHTPYIIKPGDINKYRTDLIDVLKGLLAFEYNFPASTQQTDAA